MPTIRVTLGLRIKDLRDKRGWSQYVLAEKSGISRNYLADLECGRRNVGIDNVEKLAKGFDITIGELFHHL